MRNRAPRRRAGIALIVLVLLGGLVMSFVAGAAVEAGEDRYTGEVMDRYSAEITDAITDRVARYGATLSDLAYAIGAQTDLTRDAFNRITAGLDATRLPGASGIGFIVTAGATQIPQVQRYWRARGAPTLTLRPLPGQATHDFVIFEKAFDDRTAMQGTDVAGSPQLTSVLDTARRNDALDVSPAYQLLRDSDVAPADRQAGVVLAVAVYSGLGSAVPDRFAGWVVMGLRGQDFLEQTLLDRGQSTVHVTVADSSTILATVTPGSPADDKALIRQTSLSIAQRHWQVTLAPTRRLLAATDRGMSRLALAAGAALSLLLAALTGVLAGSRNRALDQVERATTALRHDIARRESIEAQLRERETQLQQLAFHDPLTGLANRMLFYDRLTHALATHARAARPFAVLFIDLDGFKQINDQRGHQAGDTVLQVVATRLRTGLRAGDTVARFGGDEFAILLEGLSNDIDARVTAARIIEVVQQPITVTDATVRVSASVGIAVNRPDMDADDLLRHADEAMYTAKAAGKNRYAEATTS